MNKNKIDNAEKAIALSFGRKASAQIRKSWIDDVMRAVRKEKFIINNNANENNAADYYIAGAVWAFSFAVVLILTALLLGISPQKSKTLTQQINLDESEIIENIILKEHI